MKVIPKIIHYCWFGGNPLPESAIKCIESWKKHMPEYEIKEWNESNFQWDICPYVKEAYKAKKWAFVSDYARFWILYHYGGLYFDTDVEILKPLDELIHKGSFMACEPTAGLNSGDDSHAMEMVANPGLGLAAAPGLGLAAAPGLTLYKQLLDFYSGIHYLNEDGSQNQVTIVKYTTDILCEKGFRGDGSIEKIDDIYIYPPEYFCPKNYVTGEVVLTDHTYAIHHYSESWMGKSGKVATALNRFFLKYGRWGWIAERITSFPFRVIRKFETLGFRNTLAFGWKKVKSVFK